MQEAKKRRRNRADYGDGWSKPEAVAYNESIAYDLALFEEPIEEKSSAAEELNPAKTSAEPRRKQVRRKKAKIVKLPQKELDKIRRRKHNPVLVTGGFLSICIAATIVGAIIFGQSQITELNQKISVAEVQLKEAQSMGTQLEMKIQSELVPSVLENYATNVLGMSKLTNAQQEQVKLSEGDKAKIAETHENDIFSIISNAFSEMWK